MRRTVLSLALVLAGCGSSTPAVRPAAGPDAEAARSSVAALVAAVQRSDREEVRRTLSFGDLARATRPADVRGVTPAVEAAFADELLPALLDPAGTLSRLVSGLELGEVRPQGSEAVVEARGPAGPVRFVVGIRDRRPQVVRIE